MSTSRSTIFLYIKTSCSSFSILASRLPTPLGPRTSSICTFSSFRDNSLGCILSSAIYGLTASAKELSLGDPGEDIVVINLRTNPDRNRLKQKQVEKTIYVLRGIWGII